MLSATFTLADAALFTTATRARRLVVAAKEPAKIVSTLSWPTPEPITEGTALSGTQLNATASVPGTFVCTPGAGQVLAEGTHVLSVSFTPADSNLYIAAVATRTLVVTPAEVPPDGVPQGAVAIQLERVFQGPDVVSFGLPLAPGAAADASKIRVSIGGKPIDARITPLLYHHDAAGTPTGLRAVVVQFPASLMPGPTLTLGVTLGEAGPMPSDTVVPFAEVSAESPETVPVVDRTIVQDGSQYRLKEFNPRRVTLFTAREPAVLAHFPPGYLARSGVLGPQVSAAEVAADPGLAGLKVLSDALNPFVRSAVYEEGYALNPDPKSVINPVTVYEGWLYDRCATLLTATVHAGDPVVLRHALRNCSYYGSKVVLDGTYRGCWAGKPSWDSKYSHARDLFAYYALTGDESALAAVHAIGDLWKNDSFMIGPYRKGVIRGVDKLWTERLLGTGLEGLYYAYRPTGDQAYLTAFQEVVTTAHRHITTDSQAELVAINKDPNTPTFPPQGCWIHNAAQHAEGNTNEPWCSSWMSELVIESLLAYQAQTNDPRVDEIFVRLTRFLRDVGSSYFYKATVLNDTFLNPSVCFDHANTERVRRLVPLYGAGLRSDKTRAAYGEYSDFEHCPDATALSAVGLRALVRQGRLTSGGPVGPFANEGESFLALHHEFAFCAQRTIAVRINQFRDPRKWTSAKLADGAKGPAAFITKSVIGYPSHVTSPQRKLSWWFNISMLQFAALRDAGVKIPALKPGAVQPKAQPCGSR